MSPGTYESEHSRDPVVRGLLLWTALVTTVLAGFIILEALDRFPIVDRNSRVVNELCDSHYTLGFPPAEDVRIEKACKP